MGFVSDDIIAQVIDRTNIVETIAACIPLKKAGKNFKGVCPFHHEKTPSFVVNPDKQIFHCFGCGLGGNVIRFVMRHEHLEFLQALRMLAERAGIHLPVENYDPVQDSLRQQVFAVNEVAAVYFQSNLMSGKDNEVKLVREYLLSRSINAECARKFCIGYAYDRWDGLLTFLRQKGFSQEIIERSGLVIMRDDAKGCYDRFRGRVVFSIADNQGRIVAFGARSLKTTDQVKYINSPETPVYTKGKQLYGFHLSKGAVGRVDTIVIVEGYFDFIRPFSAGIENIAASLGTALTVDQIRLIRRYTRNVVMLYDMDPAGQAAVSRSLDVLLDEDMDVRIATLSDGDDPDSFILKCGANEFRERLASAKSFFEFKLERLTEEFPSETLEDRGKICRGMIPTIDRVKNEVVKSGYFRDLAQRLRVSEQALLKERQNMVSTPGREAMVSTDVFVAEEELPRDEAAILRLILKDVRWAKRVKLLVAPEDFSHLIVRRIMSVVFQVLDEKKEISTALLWERVEDEVSRRIIAAGAADIGEPVSGEEQVFNDCLARLRRTRVKSRRNSVREAIRSAEKEGDRCRVLELQKEFNQLVKE